MTYIIKGFGSIPDETNNTIGTVAEVGEISTHALTFAIEKTTHTSATYPSTHFISFFCKQDGTIEDVPTEASDAILSLVDKIYNDYDGTGLITDFIATEFPALSAVTVGTIVNQNGHHIPKSISFTVAVPGDTAEIDIWLSDDSFRLEYDEYEIKVVPPVSPITSLQDTHATVQGIINGISTADLIQSQEAIRGNDPDTKTVATTLQWVDPNTPANTINTVWQTVGYGPNAQRPENVLEAIRQYLVTNSSNTVEEWRQYLPDIQVVDRLLVLPTWENVALSAGTSGESLYSPTIGQQTIIDRFTVFLPELTYDDERNYVETISIVYKSLGMIVIGSGDNSIGNRTFSDRYYDYSIINVNDQNINRLNAATRSMIIALEALARLCEEDDGVQSLPSDIFRLTLNSVVYLEQSINGTIFRMATKTSTLTRLSV